MIINPMEPAREYVWANGDCLQEYKIYLDKWYTMTVLNRKCLDKTFNAAFEEREAKYRNNSDVYRKCKVCGYVRVTGAQGEPT